MASASMSRVTPFGPRLGVVSLLGFWRQGWGPLLGHLKCGQGQRLVIWGKVREGGRNGSPSCSEVVPQRPPRPSRSWDPRPRSMHFSRAAMHNGQGCGPRAALTKPQVPEYHLPASQKLKEFPQHVYCVTLGELLTLSVC